MPFDTFKRLGQCTSFNFLYIYSLIYNNRGHNAVKKKRITYLALDIKYRE